MVAKKTKISWQKAIQFLFFLWYHSVSSGFPRREIRSFTQHCALPKSQTLPLTRSMLRNQGQVAGPVSAQKRWVRHTAPKSHFQNTQTGLNVSLKHKWSVWFFYFGSSWRGEGILVMKFHIGVQQASLVLSKIVFKSKVFKGCFQVPLSFTLLCSHCLTLWWAPRWSDKDVSAVQSVL